MRVTATDGKLAWASATCGGIDGLSDGSGCDEHGKSAAKTAAVEAAEVEGTAAATAVTPATAAVASTVALPSPQVSSTCERTVFSPVVPSRWAADGDVGARSLGAWVRDHPFQ